MNYVSEEYDVVVVGAGPGGLAAAIQCARNGARVLLAEKNGYLGGNMTIGLPLLGFLDRDGKQVLKGIAQEFMDDLKNYKTSYGVAAYDHRYCPMHNSVTLYDHEIFKLAAFRKALDAGVKILLHAEIESANVDSGRLRSIVLSGKGYKICVNAKVFIDGTGDGDMAYLAGATYEKGQKDNGKVQPPTLMFTVAGFEEEKLLQYVEEHPEEMNTSSTIQCAEGYNADYFRKDPNWVFVGLKNLFTRYREQGILPVTRENIIVINSLLPGEVHLNCTRHQGADGSDVYSLSKAEIEGYLQVERFTEFLKEHVPGFEHCYITNIYPSLGIRESRRFHAIKTLKENEVVNGVIGDDAIGLGSYSVDIHMADGISTIFSKIPPYGIPYGITVSNEIKGLMFAGRCAGMDAVAMSSARVMPICMAIGEGAGVGAAIAVKKGIDPDKVDPKDVREILRASNVILEV